MEFVGRDAVQSTSAGEHELRERLLALMEQVLRDIGPAAPQLLAVLDEPRQIVCQFAAIPVFSGAQQRDILQSLAIYGLVAQWRDVTLLAVRRDSLLQAALLTQMNRDLLWLPVLQTRHATVWWPLDEEMHLLLVGDVRTQVLALLRWARQRPYRGVPDVLLHDPEGRLHELSDALPTSKTARDPLATAREIQLRHQWSHDHGLSSWNLGVPLLIVVAPTEHIMADLEPLLQPASGVQVVLLLGDRPPLPQLRAFCHRVHVVETADPRYPPLPDAFRPAALSQSRDPVSAWTPGGLAVWRGRPIVERETGDAVRSLI